MQIFQGFSLFCIASALVFFIIALVNKAITPPPDMRIPYFITKIGFLKYSFIATMISICLIVIYAPAATFYSLRLFENTQSTEIIFYLAFLTGCLCEGVRFLTPLFGLWSTFSDLLYFCGRIIFTGRILCPLSFLFAAITNSVEHRQDIERNITILFAICVVFAVIVPINTARISSTGAVTWGFPLLFLVSRLAFVALAAISFLITFVQQNAGEYKKLAVSMLVLLAGYALLVLADNWIFMHGAGSFNLRLLFLSEDSPLNLYVEVKNLRKNSRR